MASSGYIIPDDTIDRWKIEFQIPPSKQQFKASSEQFYVTFNYVAEGQHEQIIQRY